MKIGAKFTISLVVPLVGLTAVTGYLFEQRSSAMLREELTKEGRAIALVTQIAAEDYLRDRQTADLKQLVDRITGYQRVLGLRIFDRDGGLVYQSAILAQYPFRHRAQLEAVLRDGKPAEMRRRIGDQPVVGLIFPLKHSDGGLAGAIQVLQLESFMEEDARADRVFILALSAVMALVTASIVFLVSRLSVGGPISRMVRSFRAAGVGDLRERVEVRGDDELSHLSREFNQMCERLQAARETLAAEQEERRSAELRLRNAERLAGLGRMGAGLAHEIGTPLNVIGGRAEALLRDCAGDPEKERTLQVIIGQIDRIVRIVRDMLDFARMKVPRRSPTALPSVLKAVIELAGEPLEKRGIRVSLTYPDDLPTTVADADQLQQVFLNLVLNAADAMPEGGTLRVGIETREVANPERGGQTRPHLAVAIEDTGCGIAQEHREHVFDPFFTTKEAGKGAGLGLSVSYGIVEEHGGWFDLQSQTGVGTRVTVYLPLEPGPAAVRWDRPQTEVA